MTADRTPAPGRGNDRPPQPGTAAAIEIRPIRPDDKQALAAGFEELSDESRYRRFLSPHDRLSEAELRYLTEIDHHDHEALVALDPQTGKGVGVARYVRSAEDPSRAELAVAVADQWQRQGVGSRLAAALADRAREESITAFTALLLADNELMLNLLEDLGAVHDIHRELGTIALTVDLPPQGLGGVSRLLRAAASGEIEPVGGHAARTLNRSGVGA